MLVRRAGSSLDKRIPSVEAALLGKRPVKGGAGDFEQVGNALAVVLALVDKLAGVIELIRCEFPLTSEFHAPALRGLDAGVGAFADKAALKLGQQANHLPHRAARRRVGVDVLRQRAEFNLPAFQFVEHGY